MGSKTAARKRPRSRPARRWCPGTEQPLALRRGARVRRASIGYPVLLKAVAGGGGKGMRRVDREAELESALRDAASEAERAFRNAEIYVEKLIERPRHIEIQLLGDRHGNMVHLGERECSHPAAPSEGDRGVPFAAGRAASGNARRRWARRRSRRRAPRATTTPARSSSWWTPSGRFYFLEMNTRLQVEHPVTELVTGLDLVRLQLRDRGGRAARRCGRRTSRWRGSAIECRIYAEDPYNNFFPFAGQAHAADAAARARASASIGCVYDGWTVPIEYDPLLAKLAVWAGTRAGGDQPHAARAARIRRGRHQDQHRLLPPDPL